mgnify:CR=1 FL=1
MAKAKDENILITEEERPVWDAFAIASRRDGMLHAECTREADLFIIDRRRRASSPKRYDGFGNCLSCGVHDCENEICGHKTK